MGTVGVVSLSGALTVVTLTLMWWSHRLSMQRSTVLAELVGEPIQIGLHVGFGSWPFDAVIQSVDQTARSVRFEHLAAAGGGRDVGPDGYSITDRARWALMDRQGNVPLVHVRWVVTSDGTSWQW